MAMPELGRWEPLRLDATIEAFSGARFRWWVSGGCALELHLDRSWRDHDDTDVGIRRRDVGQLRSVLDGWDIHVAAAGRLTPWTGSEIVTHLHQNNLWCRRLPDGPWLLDVTIGEGDDQHWVYRRDPNLRVPWPEAVLRTPEGVPYLAPELQLLFKSKDRREKDDVDAREVIPLLDAARQAALTRLLPAEHPWQRLLTKHP